MGLLRFLLATGVIAEHSSAIFGLPLVQGGLAVKTFFVISGFYMTLILTSKYHTSGKTFGGGYWLFISNRFLRIFPCYYVLLLISIAFYFMASFKLHAPADRLEYWVEAFHLGRYRELLLIFTSQFTIFGLDITPIFDFSPTQGFGWFGTLGDNAVRAWRLNFIPQAWSISVELLFYVMAPFICLARKWVLAGLISLTALAYGIAYVTLPKELYYQMTYHFFPFQMGYLVLGVLSYHCFQGLLKREKTPHMLNVMVLLPFAAIIFCYEFFNGVFAAIGCIALSFFAVPLLFRITKSNRVDKFIGDLSYPMYLTHVFCKWLVLAFMGVSVSGAAIVPGWMLLAVTVLLSAGFVLLIDHPIDRWRQTRVIQQTA
jgi:peptidoglycan/LPS O-acetylase OafA/YrhL